MTQLPPPPPGFQPPPPETKRRPWWPWALGGGVAFILLLVIIVAASGNKKPTSSAAPSTVPAVATSSTLPLTTLPPATLPPAPTTTTTTAPQGVTLTITGTGPATQIAILDNGSENQHTGIALPFSTLLTDNPNVVGIDAQTSSSDPGATITCSISGGGVHAVTKTSTGAYAVVDCSATSF